MAAAAITVDDNNSTWSQAFKSPNKDEWMKAIIEEVKAHIKNQSFTILAKPKGKEIDSRWLLKIKRDANGKLVKYKARLVAKGFQQVEGIHFNETYSPTISAIAARLLFATAVQLGLFLAQLDVSTAFLIPQLPEKEILSMRPSQGFAQAYEEATGKTFPPGALLYLLSCIYGLKQASHYWNSEITKALKQFGFAQTESDPCLFVKTENGKLIALVAIYVDDVIIAGSKNMIFETKKQLFDNFPMKDLGEPSTWVGTQVLRNANRTIHLHQNGYTNQILERFNMTNCNPSRSPTSVERLDTTIKATPEEQKTMQNIPYLSSFRTTTMANNQHTSRYQLCNTPSC